MPGFERGRRGRSAIAVVVGIVGAASSLAWGQPKAPAPAKPKPPNELPAPIRVAETFDALAAGARAIQLDELVWSLASPCNVGDDVQRRQCRLLHQRVVAARGSVSTTLLVEVERGAFAVGAWDPAKQVVAYTISSCVRCLRPIEIEGKPWRVVIATGTAPRVDASRVDSVDNRRLVTAPLLEGTKSFASEADARAWIDSLAPIRIDLVVGNAAARTHAGQHVVELQSFGYRVVTPCDGKVVVALPHAANLPVDKRACVASPAAP